MKGRIDSYGGSENEQQIGASREKESEYTKEREVKGIRGWGGTKRQCLFEVLFAKEWLLPRGELCSMRTHCDVHV